MEYVESTCIKLWNTPKGYKKNLKKKKKVGGHALCSRIRKFKIVNIAILHKLIY